MTDSNRAFLNENRFHYDLLVRAGIVKHLDSSVREGLIRVIREEFDSRYISNIWCSECVTSTLRFAYEQYDQYLSKQVVEK